MVSATWPARKLAIIERLEKTAYNVEDCTAAIDGTAVPNNLGNQVVRLCLIRGIRYHLEFANSDDVIELCCHPAQSEFMRARNACLIMNNLLPEMGSPEAHPYCIWYPQTANEDTYRRLVEKYPDMRYQVGRACAVAGYTALYQELNLLPDVSIAEEARANTKTGGPIFQHIMAHPLKYAVMDDWLRVINLGDPKPYANLNADTMICSSLKYKQKFSGSLQAGDFLNGHKRYANITEDWSIDKYQSAKRKVVLNKEEVTLLSSPLPPDLPTMKKDLLICLAAYNGNIDRYSRLRRPRMVWAEQHCVIRGIYNSISFAKWFSRQRDCVKDGSMTHRFRCAINARLIMSDCIDHITDETPEHELPCMIWYPRFPSQSTMVRLAEKKPCMIPQIAQVCMKAGYYDIYMKLDITPDYTLYEGARMAGGLYPEDMERRAEEKGIVDLKRETFPKSWKLDTLLYEKEQVDYDPGDDILDSGAMLWSGKPGGIYDGFQATANGIEWYLAAYS